MERKFASKLSQRPAAEARKLASTQLKESINMAKLKPIDPIDYDNYIEQNLANLRKDPCSKQLILLPNDDIYADDYDCDELLDTSNLNNNNNNNNNEEQNTNNCLDQVDNKLYKNDKVQTSFQFNHNLNLFVNDCLQTYFNKNYEIKYKYHQYGGNYRQLPDYSHDNLHLNNDLKYEVDLNEDALSNHLNNRNYYDNYNNIGLNVINDGLEKNGWLSYKQVAFNSTNEMKEKNFKRRYFHLRYAATPLPSRESSAEVKTNGNNSNSNKECLTRAKTKSLVYKQKTQQHIYIMECFKEVPGLKKNENPKHQILFDHNVKMTIRNISNNKNNSFMFEITESFVNKTSTLPQNMKLTNGAGNVIQTHIFMADNQKTFDDWYSVIEKVILTQESIRSRFQNQQQQTNSLINLKEEKLLAVEHLSSTLSTSTSSATSSKSAASSPDSTSSPSSTSSSKSSTNLSKYTASIAKQEDIQSSSLNESVESSESLSANRLTIDQFKISNDLNKKFVDSFDLNKYLNENDEDLKKITTNNSNQINAFDIYPNLEHDHLIDEETELQCIWPEHKIGRKILIDFVQFKLNLNLPLSIISNQLLKSTSSSSISTKPSTGSGGSVTLKTSLPSSQPNGELSAINPELFFLIFSLYDISNNQKISENFYMIPNIDKYLNQLTKTKPMMSPANRSHSIHQNSTDQQTNHLKSNIFSLDGKTVSESTPQFILQNNINNSDLKQALLNKITKALFTVLDINENIFLVVRIEKILDGNTLHSSIQPYLLQMSEPNKIKAGIKLNKKMNQLLKTKLVSYRQPFAWAAKPLYKKISDSKTSCCRFELDKDTPFQIYAQDMYHLSDDDLFKYLNDYRTKEKCLNKLTQINGDIKLNLNELPADVLDSINKCDLLKNSIIINSSLNNMKFDLNKLSNDFILNIDYFEPIFGLDNSSIINNFSTQLLQYSPSKSMTNFSNSNGTNSLSLQIKDKKSELNGNGTTHSNSSNNLAIDYPNSIQPEHKEIIKKARLLRANDEFKSYIYVYPKSLKYDTQKAYSKARNILIKIELRDNDQMNDEILAFPSSVCLKSILKLNNQLSFPTQANDNIFQSNYSTIISHHNKNPQFYDEIKILLPLNLNEKHHLLFKFYHVSCTNAKSLPNYLVDNDLADNISISNTTANNSTLNSTINNKNVESLIGYAWLPIFKNGKLFNGEKLLPISQNLSNNYLSFEKIGMGQSVGPENIKWVENMKPLFKVNLVAQSTVHTIDPHVANFYQQCEKLTNVILNSNLKSPLPSTGSPTTPNGVYNPSKRQAPVLSESQTSNQVVGSNTTYNFEGEIKINLNNPNKEITRNSFKALHATDISTIIKFLPTLLNRILNTLITTVSGDVAIHSVRALIHFVWQVTSIGKIDNLKAFIKYIFYVDYTNHFKNNNHPTIHDEILVNLVILTKQNIPLQDVVQMNRLLKNCWFFLEIALKSLALYTIQYKRYHKNSNMKPVFEDNFYNSLRNFYELLAELICKYGVQSTANANNSTLTSKETDLINSFKSCNRSLAMFIKKSLNILNRKFLFSLISRYLENFYLCDKQLFQIKFDFIRIICNHEHFIAFSLPFRKAVLNISEFGDMRYEFILSDQFRQTHFLVGVVLSQLCIALNDNKEQRKVAINIFRNILCKHSYDSRYKNDKFKQARIASLYLPLIDILLENMLRLNGNNQASKSKANVETSTTRSINTTSNQTLITSHGGNSTAINSSASISNGYVPSYNESHSSRQTEAQSVLGVIAGIVNPNKLAEHIDSAMGLVSDTDSLSSADDTQFKNLNNITKRTSSSLITSSTNTSDQVNNSNSVNINSIGSSNINNTTNTNISDGTAFRSYNVTRKDKLETNEIKDLLICLVYILKNISEDALLGLWFNYDDNEFVDFLSLLELCLKTFKYRGSNNIHKLYAISKGQDVKAALIKSPRGFQDVHRSATNNNSEILDKIAGTLVQAASLTNGSNKNGHDTNNSHKISALKANGVCSSSTSFNNIKSTSSIGTSTHISEQPKLDTLITYESNLCYQVSGVILNILSLILIHHKDKLCENHGDNQIAKKIIDIYFYLLESNQSEQIKLKVFVALRMLINKTATIFLDGPTYLCSNLCLQLLKCFNSKFQSINLESTVALYLLLRKNYEHTKQKSIARVHSQTIISVSQLIGNMKLSSTNQVIDCLSILNNLAFNDQIFQNTRFSLEVDDLTKRIRNIFMATSQMKTFQDDVEMLIDSQYSLAKSYANSIELRRTWLESMAEIHVKESNFSEAAHCYLHISALIAENLKHQGLYTLGCSVFKKITPNIDLEEDLYKNDDIMANGDIYSMSGLNEVQYTLTQLLDYLNKSAEMFKMGERYDILPDIFKLAAAIHEPRDYEHLKQIYQNIEKAYEIMAERDQRAREKPLGAYYRVCFYGKMFQDQNNKVYIYKEPGNTKLFEICDRLRKVYTKRFGSPDLVELLNDNRKPSDLKLDTNNKNYIQVTYVQPYFDENEMENRVSYFERNNNLKKFYYETSYQLKEEDLIVRQNENASEKEIEYQTNQLQQQQHVELLKLCKRKTILETSHWLPYVKKRILVVYEMQVDLNPLETAIDELKQKIDDFELILKKKDITLLELYLQGGIIPQVHKGPLAYAEAFLEPTDLNNKYGKELKKKFKYTFKRLIDLYQKGIDLYGQLGNNKTSPNQINGMSSNVSSATLTNDSDSKKDAQNTSGAVNNNVSNKLVEMHKLLQDKFNEMENNFRNLLLVDGDFELYQQQLSRTNKIVLGINSSLSPLNTSSQA